MTENIQVQSNPSAFIADLIKLAKSYNAQSSNDEQEVLWFVDWVITEQGLDPNDFEY